jgi:hypothetical protein
VRVTREGLRLVSRAHHFNRRAESGSYFRKPG